MTIFAKLIRADLAEPNGGLGEVMCIAHEGTWRMLSWVSMWERHVTCGGKWQLLNSLVACEDVWVLVRSVYPTHLPIQTDLT